MHASVTRIADAFTAAASASATAGRTLAAAAKLLVRHAELEIARSRLRAILALPLFRAVAIIPVLRLEARCRVAARVRAALVQIDLAMFAGEADRTYALVRIHLVPAFAAVLTRLGRAVVDVDVAILARVTGGAVTVVVADQVDAERVVLALADAIIDVFRTVLTGEAAPASASAK